MFTSPVSFDYWQSIETGCMFRNTAKYATKHRKFKCSWEKGFDFLLKQNGHIILEYIVWELFLHLLFIKDPDFAIILCMIWYNKTLPYVTNFGSKWGNFQKWDLSLFLHLICPKLILWNFTLI